MKKVAIHSLGCKVNSYEAESMEIMLRDEGYEIVPFSEDVQADIYIINTCSVTNIADRKSRQMLHKAKKINPEAVVVMCRQTLTELKRMNVLISFLAII